MIAAIYALFAILNSTFLLSIEKMFSNTKVPMYNTLGCITSIRATSWGEGKLWIQNQVLESLKRGHVIQLLSGNSCRDTENKTLRTFRFSMDKYSCHEEKVPAAWVTLHMLLPGSSPTLSSTLAPWRNGSCRGK